MKNAQLQKYEIEKKIKSIMINCLKIDINEDDITPSTNLVTDLKINSMSFVQLIIGIEESFGIEIDDEDLEIDNFETYESLIDLLIYKYLKII
ncbi:MAG: phosphopantetheine-binding protein [Lachnospiraceae bacterium]|nr:phosphopantetheine-binding protein [Lachnospiraceae bacterium]